MRVGSGVQSAPEIFGKRQNNSKTYAAENEAFSQTSVKVYLKTDDMLFSGGNGTGLSFYIKYAEESTEDNPVVIAKGVDENGKEFEEKININDINLRNASYVENIDLDENNKVDMVNSLSSFQKKKVIFLNLMVAIGLWYVCLALIEAERRQAAYEQI